MILDVLNEYSKLINSEFDKYLPENNNLLQKNVINAMRYSLISTGKKIRPALVMEFAKACGIEDTSYAIPFACAIEMIHSYSLIHDDLPCMDDDDMRRGKPSCHIAFGEDIALLAGDGLLSLAFETASTANTNKIKPENIIAAVNSLGKCSGAMGMVGGQVIDLESENKKVNISVLKEMHKNKTGMLIICASLLGCYAANANEEQIKAAVSYATDIGIVFQIIDDVLDVIGDAESFGKPIGSDAENNKTTYATLYSIDECYEIASKLTESAKSTIRNCFGSKSDFLCEFADFLLNRKK